MRVIEQSQKGDLCINHPIEDGEKEEGENVHEDQVEPSYIDLNVLLVLPENSLLSFAVYSFSLT